MAKLPRVFQRIFGANAEPADLGVIGSKYNGNPTTAASTGVGKNIKNLMDLSNFLTGLRACVDQNRAPALQDHNSLFYILSQQIAYLMQAGIAEWESTTEYYAGSSVVLYNGVLYLAKADNIGIEPGVNADWTTYWNSFNLDFDTTPTAGSTKAVTSNGIYNALSARLPVGTILPYASATLPAGFLLCNGAAISRTTYKALFDIIGTTYGTGNGSTTFNVPNTRAKYKRNADSDSPVGTILTDGLPQISGTFPTTKSSAHGSSMDVYTTGAFTYESIYSDPKGGTPQDMHGYTITMKASRSNSIYGASSGVRPATVVMLDIIKY